MRFFKSVVSWALGVMGISSKNNKIVHISSAIERHKKLFLSEKLEIIKLYENGNSEFKISREKCLTESMIKNILKRKHELMEQATTPNKYCSAMKCTINLRYTFQKSHYNYSNLSNLFQKSDFENLVHVHALYIFLLQMPSNS